MTKTSNVIPDTVQSEIAMRIDAFNKKQLAKKGCKYLPVIKGKFIYLMRTTIDQQREPVCRLTYHGDLEDMSFAIFKWSSEAYSSSECFPGDNHIDGTLEGAMKAGLKAYPI